MRKVYILLKRAVSVNSSYPLCKYGNARFTMMPLTAMSDQVWIRHQVLVSLNYSFLICGFFAKGNGTVVNGALLSMHGGSLEITLTVPLSRISIFFINLLKSSFKGIVELF